VWTKERRRRARCGFNRGSEQEDRAAQGQLKRVLFVCILAILAVGLKYTSGKAHPRIKSLVKEAQRWLLRVLYLPGESRFSGPRTWSRSQEHHHGSSMRILLEKLGDGGLEGIQLARALTGSGGLRRRGEIFGDSSAPDVQMRGDVAQRPVLGPVQAMNFVDLFRCQHGSEFGYTDRPARML